MHIYVILCMYIIYKYVHINIGIYKHIFMYITNIHVSQWQIHDSKDEKTDTSLT